MDLVITIGDDEKACIEQVDGEVRTDVTSSYHFSKRTIVLRTGEVICGFLIGVDAKADIEAAVAEAEEAPEEDPEPEVALSPEREPTIGSGPAGRPVRDFIGGPG